MANLLGNSAVWAGGLEQIRGFLILLGLVLRDLQGIQDSRSKVLWEFLRGVRVVIGLWRRSLGGFSEDFLNSEGLRSWYYTRQGFAP